MLFCDQAHLGVATEDTMDEQKPGKRIVSKGEYAGQVVKGCFLFLIGLGLIGATLFFGYNGALLVQEGVAMSIKPQNDEFLGSNPAAPFRLAGIITAICAVCAYLAWVSIKYKTRELSALADRGIVFLLGNIGRSRWLSNQKPLALLRFVILLTNY